jgi:hypothetical protein
MTKTELSRLVKKLHYRRRLIAEVEDMETRLAVYLTSHNLTEIRINGFKATISNNQLLITETPKVDERQLELMPEYFCLALEKSR